MSTHREKHPHALSGALDQFMAVQVLRFLQMTGATGRLEVVDGDEHADIFLIKGHSAFARTTGVHLRVGDVLVGDGDIRPEGMELAAAVQQDEPGKSIGQILVASGVIQPERLREAVLEVQRRIVCRVLLWQKGRFVFHPGERPTEEDITLELDLDRLILDALRMAPTPGERVEGDQAA